MTMTGWLAVILVALLALSFAGYAAGLEAESRRVFTVFSIGFGFFLARRG